MNLNVTGWKHYHNSYVQSYVFLRLNKIKPAQIGSKSVCTSGWKESWPPHRVSWVTKPKPNYGFKWINSKFLGPNPFKPRSKNHCAPTTKFSDPFLSKLKKYILKMSLKAKKKNIDRKGLTRKDKIKTKLMLAKVLQLALSWRAGITFLVRRLHITHKSQRQRVKTWVCLITFFAPFTH